MTQRAPARGLGRARTLLLASLLAGGLLAPAVQAAPLPSEAPAGDLALTVLLKGYPGGR